MICFLTETKENVKEITRKELFNYIRQCSKRFIDEKIEYMENRLLEISNCPTDEVNAFKRKLRHFKSEFKNKWAAASNKDDRFLKNNEKWLAGTIKLTMWSKQKPGRPSKDFEECSDRSKRRKTKEIREQVPESQLMYATQMNLRAAGKSDASAVLKELTKSPTRASKVRKAIASSKEKEIQQLTPMEALSIFVEADLSRRQYNIIRSASKKLYPCYSLLQRAKAECYPKPDSYRVTDTCAEIKLQDLLDQTTSRLCKYLEEVLIRISDEEKENIELISKWGCDGSQQAQFKQKFEDSADNDANIFQSSFVPLRLISNIDGHKKIIWQNPVPSSPRFCRPIRIRFVHETSDITKEEIRYINDQVDNLARTEFPVTNGILKVKHTLMLTMVDAKVCNAVTETSSTMRCYICKATSKEFNKLEKIRDVDVDPDTLKFGLSILHARIRFFESILHLSYKIPIKQWQARSENDKQLVNDTKKRIQQKLKEEMSLLVDIPKAGYGNTNDGNTSRRFFSDPEAASRITGVDLDLIKRFKTILEVISSGHRIDTVKFSIYCNETAELYVRLYGWHPMTPTVHKILAHGPTIIDHAILPIGQLSEEAAEVRNKHFRRYRIDFARKFSRTSCNMDVINRLLLTSDPLLSCLHPLNRKRKQFSKQAVEFLLPTEMVNLQEEGDESGNSDDENVISDQED